MAEMAYDKTELQEVVTVRPVSAQKMQFGFQSPRPGSRAASELTPVGTPIKESMPRPGTASSLRLDPGKTPITVFEPQEQKQNIEDEVPVVAPLRPPTARPASSRMKTLATPTDPNAIIDCPFVEFGCLRKGKLADIQTHIKNDKVDHLSQLCNCARGLHGTASKVLEEASPSLEMAFDLTLRTAALAVKFNSQMIWRIDNFNKKLSDAKRGHSPVIYSNPFYTHRHGYRLCAALAPYGEGETAREYASVFISVLRDDNDAIQQWPFNCPITFEWMNQNPDDLQANPHIVGELVPRASPENDAFLGRPTAERNPAFGIQRFVDLNKIREDHFYTLNDVVYIRVNVDIRGLTTE